MHSPQKIAWKVYLKSQHSKALFHVARFTSAMDSVSAIPFWAALHIILRAGAILNATEWHHRVESLASMYHACRMQLKSRTWLMIAAPTNLRCGWTSRQLPQEMHFGQLANFGNSYFGITSEYLVIWA
jgi:hypothetical protein